MRLFIAEKPELAKAIVEGLGGGARKNGYFDCGGDRVTYCIGHMLELMEPEDYDQKYSKWSMADLPFSAIPWRKKPVAKTKDQLGVIMALLRDATSIVHAGDPDDEGQLIVDEILQHAKCRKPVQRLLINDNNTKIVRRALASMRDNREFAGLSAAADARSAGDLLYGVNITRAYTLTAQQRGYQGVLHVGRVQTPIIGLVVRRDRQFAAHSAIVYYKVTADFVIEGQAFPARYQVTPTDPVDEKGRLIDKTHAEGIAAAVRGKSARIVSAETQAKEAQPPLPYNLLKLQTDASRKFGMRPDQVKDITQSLRERHKLITYNRSDSEYLSDEQHADAPAVLTAIAATAAPALTMAAQKARPDIKSRAFDSSKVSAHHAIIPTETTAKLSALSDGEQKIYLLIARAYVAQFWPKHQYDQTSIDVEVDGRRFTCRSNVTTAPGWKLLYRNDAGNEDLQGDDNDLDVDMRALRAGQVGQCPDAKAEEMKTKPAPLYTMATLLTDLTRVAKYVKDERLRKLLIEKDKGKEGEHGGIGTPATRDSIIKNLFDRGYLIDQGKNVISSEKARAFYDVLPDQAKFPDMTALWHEQQKAIAAGERDAPSFVRELMDYISGEIARVAVEGVGIQSQIFACPKCGTPMRRIRLKADATAFWACTDREACKHTMSNKAGVPVEKEARQVSELHKCKACGKGLSRRPGTKRPGQKVATAWWGCSGFPECKQTYPDLKGQPDYNKRKE